MKNLTNPQPNELLVPDRSIGRTLKTTALVVYSTWKYKPIRYLVFVSSLVFSSCNYLEPSSITYVKNETHIHYNIVSNQAP